MPLLLFVVQKIVEAPFPFLCVEGKARRGRHGRRDDAAADESSSGENAAKSFTGQGDACENGRDAV